MLSATYKLPWQEKGAMPDISIFSIIDNWYALNLWIPLAIFFTLLSNIKLEHIDLDNKEGHNLCISGSLRI